MNSIATSVDRLLQSMGLGVTSRRRYVRERFDHPHANPLYGLKGQSRYLPHQGEREKTRRRRQIAERRERWLTKLARMDAPLIDADYLEHFAAIVNPARNGMDDRALGIFEDYEGCDSGIDTTPPAIDTHLGRTVTWTSSNKQKCGEVVGIVPAGSLPSEIGFAVGDTSRPRDHESYVVRADTKLYWPRVSLLNIA
jgi:hypothetical protein